MAKPIENWFDTFPIKESEARLQKLLSERRTIDDEISDLRFWIGRYRQRHPAPAAPKAPIVTVESPPAESPSVPASSNGPAVLTFRQTIFAVMHKRPIGNEWSLDELRQELHRQGAMTLDEKGNTKLLTMLSLMSKREQVERVKTGVYRLTEAAEGQLSL